MYMTNKALRLRKRKERLWKRYLDTGQDSDYSKFAKVRNELRTMTRSLKKSFEKGLLKNLKANPKAFWAYVNSKVKSASGIGTLKGQNDSMAETDSDKAEVLNNFFATTFTQEDLTTIPDTMSEFEGELLENIEFTTGGSTEKAEGARSREVFRSRQHTSGNAEGAGH